MISPVAKRHLDRAVELTPDVRAPWYERAKLNLRLKNNQQAREDAERAANIRDSQGIIIDLQLYVLLEQIYTRLGDTELAEKYANLSQRTPCRRGCAATCRVCGGPLASAGGQTKSATHFHRCQFEVRCTFSTSVQSHESKIPARIDGSWRGHVRLRQRWLPGSILRQRRPVAGSDVERRVS